MADSANILSILSALQGAPPAAAPNNVLQAAAPVDTTQPYYPADPTPVSAPVAPPEAPHRRRSLLDTVGRISDVLAKVGGAEALYQPTLDAREDRGLKLGDHARQVTADDLKIATDKFDLGDKQNLRVGQAARGLKAIQTNGGDINQAWPILAARMQLDPATTQSIGEALQAHPDALDGLIAATTDPKYDQAKYGGQVVYGKDKDGNLVAFQPGLGNEPGRNVLPDGVTPIDPMKTVDAGGTIVGYGSRSGNPQRIIPKTARPDTVLTTTTQKGIAADRNRTAITIAGMPARAQAPKSGEGAGNMGSANQMLDNIERGFAGLHAIHALPGDPNGLVGGTAAALGRTVIGQHLGEQVGNTAAQQRLAIEKDINNLQSEMIKSLPASATRTKFEQEIQRKRLPDPSRMSYATSQQVISDLRRSFVQAQKDAAAEVAAKSPAPAARPKAIRPAAKSGWTIVQVK